MTKLPLFTARELLSTIDLAVQSGYGALPVQVTIQRANGTLEEFQIVGARFSGSSGITYIKAEERKE